MLKVQQIGKPTALSRPQLQRSPSEKNHVLVSEYLSSETKLGTDLFSLSFK